ncbi:MAG: pyridoxamine 5'-phosphate oxidase family protein [Paracoccaceae bacterium]|nr:pyridoxamine 5'-phosphate oxidase family protein [Paracoccaceae bacterium]MDE2912241.1 pyridoxamine 5'-phosphate oxidase family protein [Paracoccaceae bacterium]
MTLSASAVRTIETWRLGFVATTSPDGMPNLSPKGTFVVVDNKTIAFVEMRSPGTVANLETNPDVEINFVDVLSRRGVRIAGCGTILDRESDAYEELLPLFLALWPELEPLYNRIVRIHVREVRPLASPIYEAGGQEAELRAHWKRKIAAL